MKTHKPILMSAFLSLLFIAGCSKDGENDGEDTGKVTFPTGNNDISFTAGDITEKMFVFSTTEPWQAITEDTSEGMRAAASWLEIVPSSGDAGNNQRVSIHITETGAVVQTRSAIVTISAGGEKKSFQVTQLAGSYDLLVIDKVSPVNSPADGETFTINVTCTGYWIVESDNKEVATVTPSSGTGNGQVSVTVRKNYRTTTGTSILTFNPQGPVGNEKTLTINRAASSQNYYKLWDYYPDHDDPTTAEGIVFWLKDPEGGSGEPNLLGPVDGWSLHGMVLYKGEGNDVSMPDGTYWYICSFLPEEGGIRWEDFDMTIMTNQDNGKAATDYMLRYKTDGTDDHLKAQVPAFWWIKSMTPAGYWMPSVNEWKRLVSGYHGLRYEDMADWGRSQYMPDTGLEQVRNAFNAKLEAIPGGVPFTELNDFITTGAERYHTSNMTGGMTEADFPLTITPGRGYIGSIQPTTTQRVRAIREF